MIGIDKMGSSGEWGRLCRLHWPAPLRGQGKVYREPGHVGVLAKQERFPFGPRNIYRVPGHVGFKRERQYIMDIKLKRGQKLCRNCNTINGVRSFNCKNCNNPFSMNKPRKHLPTKRIVKVLKSLVKDFTQLNPGDKIKVLKGSGPYHTDENGIKHYIGNSGKFSVDRIVSNGIMAVTQYGAHEFLYMGPEMKSPDLETLTRAPYKVILIKRKEEDNGE